MHDLEWVLVWKITGKKDILGTAGETCIYLLGSITDTVNGLKCNYVEEFFLGDAYWNT